MKVGANTKQGREMTRDLFNKLSDKFPGQFVMDRETWPTFQDLGSYKGNCRGYYRRPRIIVAEPNFPNVDTGFRVLTANEVVGDQRFFKTFDDLCAFIQANV